MASIDQTGRGDSGRLARRRRVAQTLQGAISVPPTGAYLTDGETLFCVVHALTEEVRGELFLELEDCSTLEVVLCPASAIQRLGLRPVKPALTV
jgi:hypothetical protein